MSIQSFFENIKAKKLAKEQAKKDAEVAKQNEYNRANIILNDAQKAIVDAEIDELDDLFIRESDNRDILRKKMVNDFNTICPICKSNEVVNKIARIQGESSMSGSIGGSLFGISGYMSGHGSIDTNEISHCNKCGNEWKKETMKYSTKFDIIGDWLRDINSLANGYTYGQRTVEKLKNFHAESIVLFARKNIVYTYQYLIDKIDLEHYRIYFKSIFD